MLPRRSEQCLPLIRNQLNEIHLTVSANDFLLLLSAVSAGPVAAEKASAR